MILLLASCTFGPGGPWATLEELTIESATDAHLVEVRLERLSGGVSFDPANPPDGYSLCHQGHCHSDSGALVSYEEIEAELSGDSFSTIVTVELDTAVEAGDVLTVSLQEELSYGDISLVTLVSEEEEADESVGLGVDELPSAFALDLVWDDELSVEVRDL